MNRMRIKNEPGLERDLQTNGIVNTNVDEYTRFLEDKEKRNTEEQRLNTLEAELRDIKALLLALLNKGQ
jgi:hypothetical protein